MDPSFPQGVLQVACGDRHSLFLLLDGTLLSCGDNSRGQLGRKSGGGVDPRRGQIQALEVQFITGVSCGKEHSLAVCNRGRVFAWGAGSQGQLGTGDFKEQSLIPKRIAGLSSVNVIQVACGHFHSIALSKEGELFAWGENTHGQLGLQNQPCPQKAPTLVKGLRGIPLAQITAGSAHSLALSLSGAVYAWGKNNAGQLGLGNTQNQHFPTFVECLEYKKSTSISCGADHTVVLTKDGLVFTFGSGANGQLGHNCTRNELYPRLVTALFGVRVSQVSCGSNHTLAYVPSLQKVYSFGAGEHGQMGNGQTCKQLIPLAMEFPEEMDHSRSSGSGNSHVYKIVAGGNQSVLFCLEKKNEDMGMKRISTVDIDMADTWLADFKSERRQESRKDIDLIFSSVACVNGSFLDQSKDKHFRTSAKMSGVDMSSVYIFFEKIATDQHLLQQVETAVQQMLPFVPSSPITAEAYRFYLIIPELLRYCKSESLINLFAEAILKLPNEKLKILESLWSELPASFFKVLVDLFQKASSNYLSQTVRGIGSAFLQMKNVLSILTILYKVNSSVGFKIQESNFYIPEMVPLWNLVFTGVPMFMKIEDLLWQVTDYPCAFDMQLKIQVLDFAHRKLQAPSICALVPMNVLHVQRNQLVQDTWEQLRKPEQEQTVCSRMIVQFAGEPGIDQGGLSQEFFTVISRELCAPNAKVFRHFKESCLVWFPNEEQDDEDTFFLIGRLLGMALYNRCIANFPFPLALYKKMLNVEPTLEDLKELSPTEGRSLQIIIKEENEDTIESLCLDFTIPTEVSGSPVNIDLVENGSSIPVLKYNRKQYVEAYVKYMFSTSVEKHFQDFSRGFSMGCPISTWTFLLPVELMAVIRGNTKYDWQQLQQLL